MIKSVKALWEYTHDGYEELTETLNNIFLWASILSGILQLPFRYAGDVFLFSLTYYAGLSCIYHAILVISRSLALLFKIFIVAMANRK